MTTTIENTCLVSPIYIKKLGGLIIYRLSQDLPHYNLIMVINDNTKQLELRVVGVQFEDESHTILVGYVKGFIAYFNLTNKCSFCFAEPIMPTHAIEMTEIEPGVRMCRSCLKTKYQ